MHINRQMAAAGIPGGLQAEAGQRPEAPPPMSPLCQDMANSRKFRYDQVGYQICQLGFEQAQRCVPFRTMKNTFCILLIGWTVLLTSCVAGLVPQGSQSLGTYRGILRGNVFDGPIQVQVFQAPDGETIFTGQFANTIYDGEYYFRGTMTGRLMEGKISLGFGTITGELSEDRTQMSGTFRLAQNHGLWTASLQ